MRDLSFERAARFAAELVRIPSLPGRREPWRSGSWTSYGAGFNEARTDRAGNVVVPRFAETGVERVCNLYGPSETTTYSPGVEMRRSAGFAPHIGTPLQNTRVWCGERPPTECAARPFAIPGSASIFAGGDARGWGVADVEAVSQLYRGGHAGAPSSFIARCGQVQAPQSNPALF